MLKKWCNVTSCDGVIDLYEAKDNKIRFYFWIVVMTVMSSASVWFTYRTVKGYITTPVVTNVAMVPLSLMPLPEVMVCYNGGFNVSSMKAKNLSEDFIRTFQISFNIQSRPAGMNYSKSIKELDTYLKFNNMTLFNFIQKFSYLCEDLITYSRRPNPALGDRCNDVEQLVTSLGNCYVFYNNKHQWYPGIWGGMVLHLQIPNNSFVQYYPDDAFDANLQQAFSITLETSLIHQQSKRSLLVPANMRAEITLHPKHYVRSLGQSSCVSDDRMYTSNSCPWSCWKRQLMATAGCIPLEFSDDSNRSKLDVCNPLKYPPLNFNLSHVLDCTLKCSVKCDEWIYESTVTYSNWDSVTPNGRRSSVGFGYSTLQYTEVYMLLLNKMHNTGMCLQ